MRALLPAPRWALTPPFHPYPPCRRAARGAVCFLWRFPSDCSARALPGTFAPGSPDFPRTRTPRGTRTQPSSPPRRPRATARRCPGQPHSARRDPPLRHNPLRQAARVSTGESAGAPPSAADHPRPVDSQRLRRLHESAPHPPCHPQLRTKPPALGAQGVANRTADRDRSCAPVPCPNGRSRLLAVSPTAAGSRRPRGLPETP
mmetsp:Transcript_272/g.448  ORF Transcript_272/g.448 Transcript_272/m.448 type:complete len:203 (+) Transcript_272:348-956(+)